MTQDVDRLASGPGSRVTLHGQEHASRCLERLVAGGRIPHALLFEGPPGVGKATAAHRFGALLLCETPADTHQACGACPGCRKVTAGTHADLHILADDRPLKIDAVREATRVLGLKPVEGFRKVVIVEDIDRMTPQAQNALLKTLEEPPGAAHLILTASRVRNVLPTVVSRCQRVPFSPLSIPVMVEVLETQRELDPETATLVAALAQGSLGAALGTDVPALLAARNIIAELDRRLTPDAPAGEVDALDRAQELPSNRAELRGLFDLWTVWLRDQMLLATRQADHIANRDRLAELESQAEARGLSAILRRSEALLEAKRQLDMPFNYNPQMVLEQLFLALVGRQRLARVETG